MEKEKIARGISPLLGIGKRAVDYNELSRAVSLCSRCLSLKPGEKGERENELDRKRKALSMLQSQRTLQSEFGRNLPVDQEVMADQLSREMSFSAKLEEVAVTGGLTPGVMPIRVHVPTIGQVYRFAKQIASDEPLVVEATYIKDTPFTIMKLILLLILIYALYRKRNWLKKVWDAESGWYRKHLARHVTPLSLLIISGFLFVVSFFSLPLIFTKVLFVLLMGTVFYYMVTLPESKEGEEKRREGDGNTGIVGTSDAGEGRGRMEIINRRWADCLGELTRGAGNQRSYRDPSLVMRRMQNYPLTNDEATG